MKKKSLPKFQNKAIFPAVSYYIRRRASRRTSLTTRRFPRRPPFEGAWAVVLIDNAPIRKKARREYDRVLRELDSAKAEVERFEGEDVPRFRRWMSQHFGGLMTEMRELQQKLYELEGLVNEVQREFFFGSYRSIHKAYERVKHQRAHPEQMEEPDFGFDAEEEEAFKEAEGEFNRIVDEMFSDLRNGRQFSSSRERNPREPELTSAQQHHNDRVKDLYRILVRRLHPDHAGELTPKHVEWWHQTQAAYQSGNLEQLELIFTLTEIERGGSKDTSIFILKKLTLQFKQTLKSIKQQLKKFRDNPAWNFSGLKDDTVLRFRTRASLEEERHRTVWLIQKYEGQIAQWEQTLKRSGHRRVRAAAPAWKEEWF